VEKQSVIYGTVEQSAGLPNLLKKMLGLFDLSAADGFAIYPNHQVSIRQRLRVDVQDQAAVAQ